MVTLKWKHIMSAALLVVASPACATPADDLASVINDHWKWWLSVNPVQATVLGVRDYDDKIGDISLRAQDADAATAQSPTKRSQPPTALTKACSRACSVIR
jgi:hypothetical protein